MTKRANYPLPVIENLLVQQGANQIFSILDLKQAFHQQPLEKESRPITTCWTPLGLYQWKVNVMGLRNAPQQFQQMVDEVMAPVREIASAYIDDILVGSKVGEGEDLLKKHDEDLRRVLQVLKDNQLVVDRNKCHLFVREVEFCGQVLCNGTRRPMPGKLMALEKWEAPRNVTELRSFLGFSNYYSIYLPGYAELAARLQEKLKVPRGLAKKGSHHPVTWDEEDQAAFEEIKRLLCERLTLQRMNPDKPFVIRADASRYAVGAVLEQMAEKEGIPTKEDILERRTAPVGFMSKKLTKCQRNWTPREQETYAIILALKKWENIIGLQPVTVGTDHKALENWATETLDTPSGPAGRRSRWHEFLSKFDLTVEYLPGKVNEVADGLSRWAYPASQAGREVSKHGSWENKLEREELDRKEKEEERRCRVVTRSRKQCQGEGPDSEPPMVSTEAQKDHQPSHGTARQDQGHEAQVQQPKTIPKFQFKGKQLPAADFAETRKGEVSPSMAGIDPKPRPKFHFKAKAGDGSNSNPNVERRRGPLGQRLEEHMRRNAVGESALAGTHTSESERRTGFRRTREEEVGEALSSTQTAAEQPTTLTRGSRQVGDEYGDVFNGEEDDQDGEAMESVENWEEGSTPEGSATSGDVPSEYTDVIDKPDWGEAYKSCPRWAWAWHQAHDSEKPWPEGFQVEEGKLWLTGLLCIPTSFQKEWAVEQHNFLGHVGGDRLWQYLKDRFEWADDLTAKGVVKEIVKTCQSCQACQRSTSFKARMRPFPIPPKIMWSVAIDLFTLPEVEFEGARRGKVQHTGCVCGQTFWLDRGGTHARYGTEWEGSNRSTSGEGNASTSMETLWNSISDYK